ncbi:MAG: hypothetical protein AAF268_06185 [Cyanobacteria bacterium P01_A01_bin.3]
MLRKDLATVGFRPASILSHPPSQLATQPIQRYGILQTARQMPRTFDLHRQGFNRYWAFELKAVCYGDRPSAMENPLNIPPDTSRL